MGARHAALEALEPLVVPEDTQVVVAERLDPAFGDLADGGALGRVRQPHAIAYDLLHCVVTGGTAEDEDDGRQHLASAELLDHLGAPGGAKGQTRTPPPPLPVG